MFKGDGGDQLAEPLTKIGGPVDVEGGWFDAGDFVEFTHATSYSLAGLLYAQRVRSNPALDAETRFGLKWLGKVWDSKNKVLIAQVGIGTGSEEHGKALGDERAAGWATAATHWAHQYLSSGDTGTLNLYNTSALADHDLARLIRSGGVRDAEVTEAQLVGDLKRQLQQGAATTSPFRTAVDVTRFDAAARYLLGP